VAMNQNVSPQQMLIKIAILSKMRGSLIVHQVKEETLNILMNHQKSILSLDYYFFYEDNALIFKKILSSSKFIQKLTSLPAKKFNLQKRGEIQEGYYADLVVFKDYRPYYVFVNGKLVLNAGKIENNLPGKPLETKFEI
jgi:N-acyl-D-aspartate/D-glutamate deacylase